MASPHDGVVNRPPSLSPPDTSDPSAQSSVKMLSPHDGVVDLPTALSPSKTTELSEQRPAETETETLRDDLASTTVSDTTELLEHIYSYLPLEDLILRAPRVSRRSTAVINNSKILQRLTFRAPEARKCRWRYEDTSKYYDFGPLLPQFDKGESLNSYRMNHLIFDLIGFESYYGSGSQHKALNRVYLNRDLGDIAIDCSPWPHFRARFEELQKHPDCIIMEMFVTQPPLLELSLIRSPPDSTEVLACTIQKEDGIRVRDIFSALETARIDFISMNQGCFAADGVPENLLENLVLSKMVDNGEGYFTLPPDDRGKQDRLPRKMSATARGLSDYCAHRDRVT